MGSATAGGRGIFIRLAAAAALVLAFAAAPVQAADQGFADFLKSFEPTAVAAGVSAAVYERATDGLTPDPRIPKLVSTQPEFTTPVWDYIDLRASPTRIANGKKGMDANKKEFRAVGKRYGVDPAILGAIWGIETNYGSVLSSKTLIQPIVRALATLVYQKRARLLLDQADFIAALKLVQEGPLDENQLVGSWAGAVGHLQVNPTTIIKYGTDGDGDGKVDLVDSLPDALATSAKFLLGLGYKPGIDWGFEVTLPKKFDYLLADRDSQHPVGFFEHLGVRRVNGRAFPHAKTPVFLYIPAGKDGPKFLMTGNYTVLKGYNQSDSYALAVVHLADRLKGSPDFHTAWPRDTKLPDLEQRRAIQEALIKLGLLQGSSDGLLGPVTQRAYAKFQAAHGEAADGFLSLDAYEQLSAATP